MTATLPGLPDPATRRSFLGLAAGAGLLGSIGGEQEKPGAPARADAGAERASEVR